MDADTLRAAGALMRERQTLSGLNCDRSRIGEKTVQRSRVIDCGFKGAEFDDCNFNHSYFERCHFRKAIFARVSFVNCQFRDCRFDELAFTECHFDRAEFHNCSITFAQIRSCLPPAENVLRELARNLRVNAQNRGATEDSRAFLLEEIRASEIHFYKMAFEWSDDFYAKKYKGGARVLGFWRWLLSKLSKYFWGYGEVPARVIGASAIIVIIFAAIYWWYKIDIKNLNSTSPFWDYVGFSAATFATMNYGDLVATTRGGRLLTTLEASLGLVFFGFLVAALYRKISKR